MNSPWDTIFRSKVDEESLAGFLAKVPIFSGLEKRGLNYLEQLIHVRSYRPQETVFEQGDPGSGMYLIRTGRVQIFTRNSQEREEALANLGPGDFFGETTLASPSPRTFSARTSEGSELLGLFRSDLLATGNKHPEIANHILLGLTRMLSERLQAATLEIRRLHAELNAQNNGS